MSTELVMPSNHLVLCHPLFLLPSNTASTGIQIQVKGDLFIEKVPLLQSPTYSQKNLPCREGGPLTILLGLHVPPGRDRGERRGSIQGGVRARSLGGSVCTSLPGLGFRGCNRRVEDNADENPVYPFPPGQHVWGHQDPVILNQNSPLFKSLCPQPPASPPPRARPEASLLLLSISEGVLPGPDVTHPQAQAPSSSWICPTPQVPHHTAHPFPIPSPASVVGPWAGGGGVDHLQGQLPEFTCPTIGATQAWPL